MRPAYQKIKTEDEAIVGDTAVIAPPDGLYQFRGDNTHTFYGTGQLTDREPKTIWRFETGVTEQRKADGTVRRWEGLGWTGQPAIAFEDERWLVYAASLDGYIYKLDLLTGALVLKSKRNYDIIKSSPAITDQYLLVGSWSNGMHILDKKTLRYLHSEEAVYTPSVSYDFDGSAAVEGGYAYFAGEDGYIRKLRLAPPFERLWIFPHTAPQSTFRYKKSNMPYVGIESSVAIFGDTVIVGSGRGHVYFVSKHDGELLADFTSGDDTDSSPLVDPTTGDVYIGVEKDFTSQAGGLFKLDIAGRKQWFYPVGETGVYSSAAFYGESVIFTADDGYLYALRKKDGGLVWKAKLPSHSSWSSPVVIGDRVLTADFGGYLAVFNASSGQLIWRKRFPSYFVSTPAVWDGIIVVGCRDGYIYALR